jgi:hypothetical protein
MYSKALIGYEKVVGPGHPGSQRLQENLHALDTVAEINGSENAREPSGTSRLTEETRPESKHRKLLKKFGFTLTTDQLGRESSA